MSKEDLVQRLRGLLAGVKKVEEKKMFGGVCFMVDGKMCVCARGNNELMCRVGPEKFVEAVKRKGARPMVHGGRPMQGYIFVEEAAIQSRKVLRTWVDICLDYNKKAIASPERGRGKTAKKTSDAKPRGQAGRSGQKRPGP